MKKRGIIVKGISGFYYVSVDENNGSKIYCCKGRGLLKNHGRTLYVGDIVEINLVDEDNGVIEKVTERKNSFIRPPISNVDAIVIVVSATVPKANPYIIDKFMVMASSNDVEVILCINKIDDVKNPKDIDKIREIYNNVCPIVLISGILADGMEELKDAIKGKKVAFAGPSGVGKSTIINSLKPELNLETGNISEKSKRGKHTTRHVEVFKFDDNTFIYDTPGFTSFDLMDISSGDLKNYFTEIDKIGKGCKYRDCIHEKEPQCKVVEAVSIGNISKARYESYIAQLKEIRDIEKKKF